MEDLARRMEDSKNGISKSRGIASDRESQRDAARSSRGLRGGNRIARIKREITRLVKALRIRGM